MATEGEMSAFIPEWMQSAMAAPDYDKPSLYEQHCFVCDSRSHVSYTNIFNTETAIKERLQLRLEGVLAVNLVTEQEAEQNICTDCQNKLVNIETIASGLRKDYLQTQSKYSSKLETDLEAQKTREDEVMSSPVKVEGKNNQQTTDNPSLGSESTEKDATATKSFPIPTHEASTQTNDSSSEWYKVEASAILETVDPDYQTGEAQEAGEPEGAVEQDGEVEQEGEVEPVTVEPVTVEPAPEEPEEPEDLPVPPSSDDNYEPSEEEDQEYRPRGRPKTLRSCKKPRRKGRPRKVKTFTKVSTASEDSSPTDDGERPVKEEEKDEQPTEDEVKAEDIDNSLMESVEESKPEVKKPKKRGRPRKYPIGTRRTPAPKKARSERPLPGMRSKQTRFPCDSCSKVFNSGYKLTRHKIVHTDARPYQCDVCHATFKSKFHLERHNSVHTGVKKYQCDECEASFRGKNRLTEHKLIHRGQAPYTCNVCGQTFNRPDPYKAHMCDHSGEWPEKCEYCGKGFLCKSKLLKHVTVHTGEKGFQCEVCGDKFRIQNTLHIHMRKHTGTKPHQCDQCPKRFVNSSALKEHKRMHAGVRGFLCQQCGASFVQQSGLFQHMMTHMSHEDRKFPCTECDKRFYSRALLRNHMRRHTGERPYMCQTCGKSFRRSGELTVHQRYHNNERRYECPDCRSMFFTKSHLLRHQRNHCTKGENAASGVVHRHRKTNMGVQQAAPLAVTGGGGGADVSVDAPIIASSLAPERPDLSTLYNLPQVPERESAVTNYQCVICHCNFRDIMALRRHSATIHSVVYNEMAQNMAQNSRPYENMNNEYELQTPYPPFLIQPS